MVYKFEVEIARDNLNLIGSAIRQYFTMYYSDVHGLTFKMNGPCNQKDWLLIDVSLIKPEFFNVWPLEVMIPQILHRVKYLPKADASEYDDYDVSIEQTITVSVTPHGIEIRPTFQHYGK